MAPAALLTIAVVEPYGSRPDPATPGQAPEPTHFADSDGATGGAIDRLGSAIVRLVRVWQALTADRRLAAFAAIGLFATLFLPWYQETVITANRARLQSVSASVTGWGAFSFVEAALLVVVAGVLTLLFQRAEGRAFHLPGGDGFVIMLAGGWACVLVVWRIFDKQGTSSHGQLATTWGVEWGIFIALAVAGLLAYAGARVRAARQPEPPLLGEVVDTEAPGPPGASPATPPRARVAAPPEAALRPSPRTSAATATPPLDSHEQPTVPLDQPPAAAARDVERH